MSEKDLIKEDEMEDNVTDTATQEGSTDQPNAEEVDPIEQMEKEIADLKDQNLRLFAEFENFRKRTAKERIELFGSANQDLMTALLPILDDFERAIKAQEGNTKDSGTQLIYNKLENTLKNKGLKPMEDSTGKPFDADLMEAVTQIPAPSSKLKGKVVDEIERGYQLGNKILRYAKVVVGQ